MFIVSFPQFFCFLNAYPSHIRHLLNQCIKHLLSKNVAHEHVTATRVFNKFLNSVHHIVIRGIIMCYPILKWVVVNCGNIPSRYLHITTSGRRSKSTPKAENNHDQDYCTNDSFYFTIAVDGMSTYW